MIYGILKILLWIKTTVEWAYANDIKVTQSTKPLLLCINVELFFKGVRLQISKVNSYPYFWYFDQLMFYLIMLVHSHQYYQYFD